jgi:hypothetical protein
MQHKDYHGKEDRHKEDNRSHGQRGKKLTKWERRKIVAWDGEGANLESGEHIYNLLANSQGTRLYHEGGISTKEALNFFLTYGDPQAINVIYGGSYDVNMILRDLNEAQITALWANGCCYYLDYKIDYALRKKFTVTWMRKDKDISFTLWDVLGYFQASFVVACRKWLGDLPILRSIEDMKYQRSEFTEERKEDIIEYNRIECELLVQLMEALCTALDNAGIRLTRYDGAGSIAAALLRANGVLEHKGAPNEEVLRWAQHAYSGGRIEAPKIGHEIRPIYRYDINSAYPSSCLNLPSYTGATWSFDKEWDGQDCSMVHIEWCFSRAKRKQQPFYPLWYREPDGTMLYPRIGKGIYWGVEARNIIEYADPRDYEIIGACNVHLANDTKPFKYLEQMYHARLILKQRGDMANEAFKLGMNSTYGKLAQQAGYRNGRIPRYHQLLWAGQITATTRAQLYRAAMQEPRSVIAFATDAVITTKPLDLKVGTGLGEWTHDSFTGITIVQPGVYWLQYADEWKDKYRGFDKGTLHRQAIVGCWLMGQDFTASLTRFVGMGSALASSDFRKRWRTWETNERVLTLTPGGKRMPSDDVCYWDHLCDTIPTYNLNDPDLISKAYPLLWVDGYSLTWDMGKVLEHELNDSYE